MKFQSDVGTLCQGIFLQVSHVARPRENINLEIPRTAYKTARETELDLLVPAELLQFVLRFLYWMGVILHCKHSKIKDPRDNASSKWIKMVH